MSLKQWESWSSFLARESYSEREIVVPRTGNTGQSQISRRALGTSCACGVSCAGLLASRLKPGRNRETACTSKDPVFPRTVLHAFMLVGFANHYERVLRWGSAHLQRTARTIANHLVLDRWPPWHDHGLPCHCPPCCRFSRITVGA